MQNSLDTEVAQRAELLSVPRQLRGRLTKGSSQRLVVIALILADTLLVLLAWAVFAGLYGLLVGDVFRGATLAGLASGMTTWVGLRALLGLYPGYGLDQVEELRRQTHAGFAAICITAVFLALSEGSSAGWLIAVSFSGLLLVAPVTRYCAKRAMLKVKIWGKPVAVLSSGEGGASLLKVLRKEWQLGFRPTVVYEDLPTRGDELMESVRKGGLVAQATELSRQRGVDTVIFAMPYTRREDLMKLVSLASINFRRVVVIPNLVGITNSAVIARDFAGSLGVEIRHNLLYPWARRTKRVLDLLATILGGLLISPLLIVVVVLIKLDSQGPVFYGHRRLGAGGNHFCCWKFRTMHTNAEQLLEDFLKRDPDLRAEWNQNFKLRDDPRVTRVGRFLRKSSLDELPQLWNVLRGEMSLVGPRPIVDAEVPKYGLVYETYRRIKPGISGFWQVSGRSDTSYNERIKLDAYYVHNWSVWLDVVILARTLRCVLSNRGAY